MKGRTILVGTNHIDPRGPQRLEKLLEYLEPDILTVESSDERKEAFGKQRGAIRSVAVHIDKELLEEWFTTLSPAYEVYVSQKYSKKYNISLHKIDIPYVLPVEKKDHEEELEKWPFVEEEFIRSELLRWKEMSINLGLLEAFDLVYYDPSFLIKLNRSVKPGLLGTRDKYMVKRIKQIREQNPDSKIVHVGGVQHMVRYKTERKVTMYCLIPKREVYFLPEADFI